jgi:hypothetical protein
MVFVMTIQTKRAVVGACLATCWAASALAVPRAWQQLNDPMAAEVASRFAVPPPEYAVTLWWGWNGPVDQEVIRRDLDAIHARGLRSVLIEAGYEMRERYLSPGWFELVRYAVEQARLRGMRVWIEDEGKYPSGFAGGKFSALRPDLRMQALVVAERIKLAEGETLLRKLSPDAVGVLAVRESDKGSRKLDGPSGELSFTATDGAWEVLIVEHQFRTSVTRSANNPTRGKDASASLCDYLNPAATRQFIAWTHEEYKRVLGPELGQTFMGFMGDEPDYGYTPWTPEILREFETRKGYDIRPHLASFFAPRPNDAERRAKADYWDVWSDLFRDNFFTVQAEWCAANGVEYLVHLNQEDRLRDLARSEGDYFKNMRHVQVPGVDAIWNQIWPGTRNDFPKYASSAAHLFGRPRAYTESFAAYRTPPTVEQARWVINHQLARGINLVQIMFHSSSASSAADGAGEFKGWLGSADFPAAADYANRATYLLAQGRPTATIALYLPTTSLWLGDDAADPATLKAMEQLLAHQRDFDCLDEQALSALLPLEGDAFRSLSGSSYRAVIIPGATIISRAAHDRLRAFAKGGGRVIILGQPPSLLNGRTFLKAEPAPALDWATTVPSGDLSAPVLAALPPPDLSVDPPAPALRYVHRRWRDAELYFVFNEGDERLSARLTLRGRGHAQRWDAETGRITLIKDAARTKGSTSVTLDLAPHATQFIVLGPRPAHP